MSFWYNPLLRKRLYVFSYTVVRTNGLCFSKSFILQGYGTFSKHINDHLRTFQRGSTANWFILQVGIWLLHRFMFSLDWAEKSSYFVPCFVLHAPLTRSKTFLKLTHERFWAICDFFGLSKMLLKNEGFTWWLMRLVTLLLDYLCND